jgi:DNA mismatch repair protein MutS2
VAADFKEKDEVFILSLKKLGTVLGASKSGGFFVQVGSLRIECRPEDLQPRATLSKSLEKTLKRMAKPVAGTRKTVSDRPVKLDLHGMRVEDALRTVEKAMDRAIIDGVARMEIVHGIGAGKIRSALHQYLASLPIIETYRVDDQNPGVTWVYF